MNRNVESHFALNPTRIDMSRSTFDRSCSVKTSFNVGDIVPFFLEEVLPGDTFNVRTSKVVRMQTLLTPMMDNVYLDSYYFLFRIVLFGTIGRSLTVKTLKARGYPRRSILFLRLRRLLLVGLLVLLPIILACLQVSAV